MKTLLNFFKLSRYEQCILLKLSIFVFRAEIILRLMPYSYEKKLVFKPKAVSPVQPADNIAILRTHLKLLNILCRKLPYKVTCLRKAVALRDSLASSGVTSSIKIGLGNNHGDYVAHAWLECCGYEVLKNGTYTELERIHNQ